MGLLRAMTTVAGMTGLSRIAGFARDVLMASILGAGPIADAFFVALKLPNFFRRVTAEGAFSVSFVPVYTETLTHDGAEEANRFANNAFWIMSACLLAFSALAMLFMPYIIAMIAPGFQGDPQRFDMAVYFSRITFPYLLLMSLSALLGGVLNTHGRFAPFAFAPTLFNLFMVFALLMADWFETPGHALSWGISISGVAQLLMLLYFARKIGFGLRITMPKWQKPLFSARIKRVFILMGPGVLGAGVMHINLFADMIIASFLAEGSISYLYYADRLNQLPLGVIGIAVGTALLPMLSSALSKDEPDEARNLFNRSLEYCMILALPAAVALMIIPHQIIGALFERGAFEAKDTYVTAQVLAASAIGLPAYILIKIFSTVHWARQDTMTPVRISIIGIVFNIALSLVLIFIVGVGVAGIALATGIAGWLQLALHFRTLRRTKVVVFDAAFKRNMIKTIAACALMALVLFVLMMVLPAYISSKIIMLGALIAAGLGAYGAFAYFSGLVNLSAVQKILARRRARRAVNVPLDPPSE